MKTFVQVLGFSSGLLLCSLAYAQSQTADPSLTKAEARQLSQDTSPQARSQLARREAHAAHKEAMSACKSLGKAERKACSAEANTNLKNDLNYAKEIRTSGTSMGGSGAGSDRVSGSNDLSSAGSSGAGMTGTGASGNDRSGSARADRTTGQATAGMSNESISKEKLTPAEKQQFVQSFTPQAQYNLSKREAHAAHSEALKACKPLSRAERSACTKEARAALQQDLATAKRNMQEAASGAKADSATPGASR
jgi:hypothetical protein